MDKNKQIEEVKALGDKIGYGNLMQIASALWAIDLEDKVGSSVAAHVSANIHDLPDRIAYYEQDKAVESIKVIRDLTGNPLQFSKIEIIEYIKRWYDYYNRNYDFFLTNFVKFLGEYPEENGFDVSETHALLETFYNKSDGPVITNDHPIALAKSNCGDAYNRRGIYYVLRRGFGLS